MVWAGILLAFAITPRLSAFEEFEVISHQDKIYHFVEYMVLAILIAYAFIKGTDRSRDWKVKASFYYPAIYGIILEVLQALVPARSVSILDIVANMLGALTGTIIAVQMLKL